MARRSRPFAPPLRLLVALPNPADLAPLNVDMEREILERALAVAVDREQVIMQFLSDENATIGVESSYGMQGRVTLGKTIKFRAVSVGTCFARKDSRIWLREA